MIVKWVCKNCSHNNMTDDSKEIRCSVCGEFRTTEALTPVNFAVLDEEEVPKIKPETGKSEEPPKTDKGETSKHKKPSETVKKETELSKADEKGTSKHKESSTADKKGDAARIRRPSVHGDRPVEYKFSTKKTSPPIRHKALYGLIYFLSWASIAYAVFTVVTYIRASESALEDFFSCVQNSVSSLLIPERLRLFPYELVSNSQALINTDFLNYIGDIRPQSIISCIFTGIAFITALVLLLMSFKRGRSRSDPDFFKDSFRQIRICRVACIVFLLVSWLLISGNESISNSLETYALSLLCLLFGYLWIAAALFALLTGLILLLTKHSSADVKIVGRLLKSSLIQCVVFLLLSFLL